jgi:hypothetical protein
VSTLDYEFELSTKVGDFKMNNKDSTHYSSVVCISKEDAAQLQEHILEKILETRALSLKSVPEDIFCINYDFFRI